MIKVLLFERANKTQQKFEKRNSRTNTNSLGTGTHTVTCTVTKAEEKTSSASMTGVVNSKKIICPACNGRGYITQ